jgi:hypothetical protein
MRWWRAVADLRLAVRGVGSGGRCSFSRKAVRRRSICLSRKVDSLTREMPARMAAAVALAVSPTGVTIPTLKTSAERAAVISDSHAFK